MKIERVCQHAVDRAIDRFGIKHNVAEDWVRNNLKKAKFIAITLNDKGQTTRLYAHNRIGFVLAAEENIVITLYSPNVPPTMYEKVSKMVERELAKLETNERKVTRRNTIMKAELNVEIAEHKLRLMRARAESTKMAINARLAAIEERIAELDAEIVEAKRAKTIIAKGAAAYL